MFVFVEMGIRKGDAKGRVFFIGQEKAGKWIESSQSPTAMFWKNINDVDKNEHVVFMQRETWENSVSGKVGESS